MGKQNVISYNTGLRVVIFPRQYSIHL